MNRVFVFAKWTLFSQGIKHIFDTDSQITIVGWESDIEKAMQGIQETQPDVVLNITQDKSASHTLTCENLTKSGVKTKLIEISLQDANIYIYQGEQRTITEIKDLIGMI